MDSGWAALLGSVVGAVSSLAATWLSELLRNRKTNRLDRLRKERLLHLLSGRYIWRSLDTLADSIGADERTTVALLLELGCRQTLAKGRSDWALISRAPFPDQD